MKLRVPLAILLVMALTLVGCSSGDDASPTTQAADQPANNGDGGGSGQDSGGDGDGSSTGGGGFTPDDARAEAVGAGEDFPIPIPGGWKLDGLVALEEAGASFSGGVQLYYSTSDLDELVAFYDEWTADQPEEFARSESEEIVVYTKTSPLAQISINKDFEFQGELWTFLLISAASE